MKRFVSLILIPVLASLCVPTPVSPSVSLPVSMAAGRDGNPRHPTDMTEVMRSRGMIRCIV